MDYLGEEYNNLKILKDRIAITKDEAKKEIMTDNLHKRKVKLLEQLQDLILNKDENYDEYKNLFNETFHI